MELAIVIPYYRRTFFEATLESLAAQTDKRFKVYIGDDASPIPPAELLKKYDGKFDFNYQRFDVNLGSQSLVQQWNRCLELTQEENWTMILGDDDVLASNAVEQFYQHLETSKATVFRFATQLIDETGKITTDIFTHPENETSVDFIFRKSRSSLSEYVFSSQKMREIGFKDLPLAWFSDILAVLEFSGFGNVYSINDALVYVRVSSESISGRHEGFVRKNAAAITFYSYLLTDKKKHFTRDQQRKLFPKINKCYRNDKKKFGAFFKISYIYLRGFFVAEYFDFLRSIAVSVKNNKP